MWSGFFFLNKNNPGTSFAVRQMITDHLSPAINWHIDQIQKLIMLTRSREKSQPLPKHRKCWRIGGIGIRQRAYLAPVASSRNTPLTFALRGWLRLPRATFRTFSPFISRYHVYDPLERQRRLSRHGVQQGGPSLSDAWVSLAVGLRVRTPSAVSGTSRDQCCKGNRDRYLCK